MAGGNTSVRGKPFKEKPPGARPNWKPGESGNASGRPKQAPAFRARCRAVAEQLAERIAIEDPEKLAGLAKAFEAVADRGGYLSVDKLVHAEVERRRSVLDLMESPALTQDQKNEAFAQEIKREQEILGETERPALEGKPDAE